MDVTTLNSSGEKREFSLRGQCPHCNNLSVCTIVGQPYAEKIIGPTGAQYPRNFPGEKIAAIMQCPGCKGFVLGVVKRASHPNSPGQPSQEQFVYEAHYSLGSPDQRIGPGIPEQIGEDFKEALRCRFVKAYKACVIMCRRALESSCEEQNAKGSSLDEKIDNLATRAVITAPLKELAHRIRLTGNRGAHPPNDEKQASEEPTEKRADAIVEFTRQYLENVYSMPFKIKSFDSLDSPKPG